MLPDPTTVRIPRLRPYLKLFRNPESSTDGQPTWSLHDPLSNNYFRLNWAEFECLGRFARAAHVAELREIILRETSLDVSIEDIYHLIATLQKNGLVLLDDQRKSDGVPPQTPFWKRLVHNYLYITIPLCRPDVFLRRTLSFVNPLLSHTFFIWMMAIFAIAAVMTLHQWDSFAHTFTDILSAEGAVLIALTFAGVKIIHELAHAYTAVRNGVHVPHLGVAFMVLYPILYTETSGAWQLPNHQQRRQIALAGIRAELCLAALALMLWHYVPAGSTAQTLCFLVVAVSLVSSLLVNLNPLMRFDGYYILSDTLGLENLQSRACGFARWRLRRYLFGWTDDPPEFLPSRTTHFLVCFGFTLILYRFFLFTGIAFLVYHLFFEPLGAILFMIEVFYFILLPIASELAIWRKRSGDIWTTRRGRISLTIGLALLVFLILPSSHRISLPAIITAQDNYSVYPPTAAYIRDIAAKNGDSVRKGDLLMAMSSPELDRDYALAANELTRLEALRRSQQADANASAIDQLAALRKKMAGIESQQRNLTITAPFDGIVRDMSPFLRPQMFVNEHTFLLRVIDVRQAGVMAYATQQQMRYIHTGDSGFFRRDKDVDTSIPLTLTSISPTNSEYVEYPALSSTQGGAIAAEIRPDQQDKYPVPVRNIYLVHFQPLPPADKAPPHEQRGFVVITGSWHSPLMDIWASLTDKFMRK